MQQFRTIIQIPESKFKIDYSKNLFFIGSCFTENIGNKFNNLLFNTDINPFGIIYNPISIANSFEILINEKKFTSEDIFFHNQTYQSFFHHSRFSNSDKDLCLNNINKKIEDSTNFLKTTNIIFVTFGTAFIYNLLSTNQTVSNCHKLAAQNFEKKLLSVEEIVKSYKNLLDKLINLNPNIKIVFTVSPIRHWNDGAVANQLSKATLIVAINQLLDIYQNANYFPSYEIVMDELRDYRFYADDMLHISQVAIDYIYEKFTETYFDKKTFQITNEISKLLKAKEHRPFDKNSEGYKKFLEANLKKIKELEINYGLNIFENLKTFFKFL